MARAYLHRPPYPPETFSVLADLITDTPKRVLDVGCGTGGIARHLAPLVDYLEAVDFSEPMIETARRLPGGDSPKITWKVGTIESVPLSPPYGLIVGGQSLHWVDWNVALPRFRRALSGHGFLAMVELEEEPAPWKPDIVGLIREYSTNPDYRPLDLAALWQESGAFVKVGESKTASVEFCGTPDDYVEYLHSMSSLTRSSMGEARAREFDSKVKLVLGHRSGRGLGLKVFSKVAWGTVPG